MFNWKYNSNANLTDDRSRSDYVEDLLAITKAVGFSVHARRGAIYQLSEAIWKRLRARDAALQSPSQQYWSNAALCAKSRTLIYPEHVVPRKSITYPFSEHPEQVGRREAERAIELFMLVCWVHRDSELPKLDSLRYPDGTFTKSSMPPNWHLMSGDVWARYEFAKTTAPVVLGSLEWKTEEQWQENGHDQTCLTRYLLCVDEGTPKEKVFAIMEPKLANVKVYVKETFKDSTVRIERILPANQAAPLKIL